VTKQLEPVHLYNKPDFDSNSIFCKKGEYFPHFKLLSLVQNDH